MLIKLGRLQVYRGDCILRATVPCNTAAAMPLPLVSRQCTHHRNRKAEVKRLDYVHALRHCPSSLFTGLGDAPAFPLSC